MKGFLLPDYKIGPGYMKHIFLLLVLLAPLNLLFALDGEAGNINKHGFSSERLRAIMQKLNLTVTDSTDPDYQPEDIASTDMEDMQEAVEELLFHAELLSTELPEQGLDESGLVTFRAIASQLYTETLNIKQIAENYSTNDQDLLYSAYHRLYQTCAACHNLFRD